VKELYDIFSMPKRFYDKFDTVMAEYHNLINNEYVFHAIETGEIVYPGIEGMYCPEVKNSMDYWSINFYTRDLIDANLVLSSVFGKSEISNVTIAENSLNIVPSGKLVSGTEYTLTLLPEAETQDKIAIGEAQKITFMTTSQAQDIAEAFGF